MKKLSAFALLLVMAGVLMIGASTVFAQEHADDHAKADSGSMGAPPEALTKKEWKQLTIAKDQNFGDIGLGLAKLGAALGAGLVMIGGAAGIGRIGGSAVEAMARQPEAAGSIQTAMIITAAMVEGATLFGVIVCLLAIIM